MKKIAISTLIILIVSLVTTSIAFTQNSGLTAYLPLVMQSSGTTATATSTTPTATPVSTTAYTQSGGVASLTNRIFTASETDESAINVTDGGILTVTYSTITTTGNTSSQDNSSFYGQNAAVLAESASQITISDSSISTTGTGANGAFATGSGSSVTLTNVTIDATANGGHGVMATIGGVMTLTNVDITTAGANSAPVATDRGSGTITVDGGSFIATGQDSPGIYSTGVIEVTGATVIASGAESAVIEGSNSISLINTTLTSSKEDKWGVMIYQSMSGDAEGAEGTFTMTGGSLANTAASGPLFYVTNSTGIITLNGVTINAASGTLLNAAMGNWGTSGSNGGIANLTGSGQTLIGNLVADSASKVAVVLQNSSTLSGAINAANTASEVNLTLDASSTWSVTANSYLTCLVDSDGISGTAITNILGNGYTVYYDSNACSGLGSQTYTLNGGGYLEPAS